MSEKYIFYVDMQKEEIQHEIDFRDLRRLRLCRSGKGKGKELMKEWYVRVQLLVSLFRPGFQFLEVIL